LRGFIARRVDRRFVSSATVVGFGFVTRAALAWSVDDALALAVLEALRGAILVDLDGGFFEEVDGRRRCKVARVVDLVGVASKDLSVASKRLVNRELYPSLDKEGEVKEPTLSD
jgi:hypothetical protein